MITINSILNNTALEIYGEILNLQDFYNNTKTGKINLLFVAWSFGCAGMHLRIFLDHSFKFRHSLFKFKLKLKTILANMDYT